MTTRPVPLKAGSTAWIVRQPSDNLSPDLQHNQRVTVMSLDGNWAFISDGSSVQRRISVTNLDAGREYQGTSGHWYAEGHPRVQAALKKRVEALVIEGGDSQQLQKLRDVVERQCGK